MTDLQTTEAEREYVKRTLRSSYPQATYRDFVWRLLADFHTLQKQLAKSDKAHFNANSGRTVNAVHIREACQRHQLRATGNEH